MSKKDLVDRVTRGSGESRSRRQGEATPARSRADSVTTRVNKRVVRRRRTSEAGQDDDKPAARRSVAAGNESEAAAPKQAAEPKQAAPEKKKAAEPASEAPKAAPAKEAKAPAAEPAEKKKPAARKKAKPAEPAPAPAEKPKAAAKPAAKTKAAAKPAEAKPAEPKAPEAKPEPKAKKPAEAEAKPAAAEEKKRPYRGLGSAVVVPPPGYDPSNPEAYRARQATPSRGPSTRGPSGGPGAGAAAPAGDARPERRGRRRVASGGAAPAAAAGRPPAGRGRGRRPAGGGGRGGYGGYGHQRRRRKSSAPKAPSPQPKAQKRKIRVDSVVSVGQLAHELSVKAAVVIRKLMEMGQMVTINEMLDFDTAVLVAAEFDYEVENVGFNEDEYLQSVAGVDEDDHLEPRPPVVTIMGHVDHGKTTLLDAIRSARVAAGEAGGITQHIGAYQVEHNGQTITFLDTPGHAAFSAMRARGASVTDIVVLVVAADDGVQPQTIEAISHAQAAGVPIIVAVNKIDKPGVNPDVIKQRMGEFELIPEEWGGETLFANVSALKQQGIEDLLEQILLQAEILDLHANPERHAEGVVIEAKVERGRGPVASVLVQQGTLKRGDHVVLGSAFGKVRAMMDFKGKKLKQAGPSTPVEIFGLSELPGVGDTLSVVANEKNARTLAEHRADEARQKLMARTRRRTLEDLIREGGAEERKVHHVVIKADVQGSMEALRAAIQNIEVNGTEIRVLHAGVGNISESDVNLVAANGGSLFGFNVKVDPRARKAADEAGVEPELHKVIYSILDVVEARLKGMLEPVYEEEHQGSAEVRAVFKISRIGTVAGCYVLDGKVGRHHGARVFRDGKEIWKGDVDTVKRFKDDVREVSAGYECGISLDGFDDLREGDVIETFAMVQVSAE